MRIPSAVLSALTAVLGARAGAAAPPAGAAPAVVSGRTGAAVASLAVAGPRGCVLRADVVARVASRSQRIRFVAEAGRAGPALRVTVDAAAGGGGALVASLTFVWPGGARSERRLTAKTCPEVADAVALVIALALDPAAKVGAEVVPGSAATTPREDLNVAGDDNSPLPNPPPADGGRGPEGGKGTLPSIPSGTLPPIRSGPLPPSAGGGIGRGESASKVGSTISLPAISRFTLGLSARVTRGPAPRPMPGVGLSLAWRLDRASPWTWAMQIVAATYADVTWAAPGGTATFGLDLVTLDLCPLRLGVGRAGLRLCGSATVGRLAARGSDTFSERSRSRLFASAGGAALVAVTPHPHVELTASVEPSAALVRDSFTFDPAVFYAVPRLILTFGVGVAVTFP